MYEIRLFTKLGIRKALSSRHCGPCSYTVDSAGGFADFTVSLFAEPDELTHIAATDRVEVWHSGVRQYRGYISDLRRSEGEPATLELSGYGRVLDLTNQIITGYYQYPMRVDVSRCFSEIAAEVTARHPEVVVQVDEIGSLVETLDTNGKTVKEALDALLEFARSSATYGFDTDELGRDRLYLRKIADTVSHTIVVPAASTGQREATKSIADLVNVVRVTGGDAKYPQMLPNPSMEVLRKAGDSAGGNLLDNPSFENGGTGWTFSGGASRKTNGNDDPPAFSGNACAELDQPNEQVSQDHPISVTPLVPGKPYLFGFWIRGEYEAPAATPPTIRAELTWWNANGYEIRTDNYIGAGEDQSWQQQEQVFVCPAGAVGFKVSFKHVYGSYGNQRGAIIDDIYLQDATQMYVDGWKLVPFGDATIEAETARTGVGIGKHGRTAAYLKFQAQNQDGHDIHFVYGRLQGSETQGYTVGVVGGRTYRFSVWQRYEAAWQKPLQKMEMRWRKSDGSVLSTSKFEVLPNSTLTDWQEISVPFTAPNEATAVEPWITMRSDGEMLLDCISLRDAADPDIDTFLDTGPLTVSFAATDLFDAATDPELNASITTYGRREKSVSVSGITTIADAHAWATEYLRVHALLNPAPQVTVYDYSKTIQCGDLVRLVGAAGSSYCVNPVPVARVNAEINDDGILVQNLELLNSIATEEELYTSKLRNELNQIASSSGAAGATSVPRDGVVVTPGATISDASATIKGITRLSVAPVSSSDPVAAGTNDPRMSDARTPLPHNQNIGTITGGAANQTVRFESSGTLSPADNLQNDGTDIVYRSGGQEVMRFTTPFTDNTTPRGGISFPGGGFLSHWYGNNLRISGSLLVPSGSQLFVQDFNNGISTDGTNAILSSYNGWRVQNIFLSQTPAFAVAQNSQYSTQPIADFYLSTVGNTNDLIRARVQTGSSSIDTKFRVAVDGSVYTMGYFQPGGYRATDGTTGATATVSGLVFKNGLYTSGSISSTNPGGSIGSIQYRDGNGNFAGDSNIAWDSSNQFLKIATGSAGQLAPLRLTTTTANRSRSLLIMTGEGTGDQAQIETWVAGGSANYVPSSAPGSAAGDAGIRVRYDKSFWISDISGSADQWRVKVASDATIQPRGGYRTTDGTTGATATTGGATFKNGLYTGGSISGSGTGSNLHRVELLQGASFVRNNTLQNAPPSKHEYVLPYAQDGSVLYYSVVTANLRLSACSTSSANEYANVTTVVCEKSTGSGAFSRPYGGSNAQGEQICSCVIGAGNYEKIGITNGSGNITTYPKSGDKIAANVIQMGVGTDGYTFEVIFSTSTTDPSAGSGGVVAG